MTRAIKPKIGIRHKVVLFIVASNLIVMTAGIGLGYFLGYRLLYNTIGGEYQKMAEILGSYISGQVGGEVEDINTYASRPLWVDYTIEANKRYEQMDAGSIQRYLKEMDGKWAVSGKEDPFVGAYVRNRVGESMDAIRRIRKNIAEIFITDRFGGLVAASGKTSDFYQADEEWWKKTYNDGKGGLYLGDVELDESSGTWSMPMAVSMRDKDGNVIGICKQVISIERLFSRLRDIAIGRTGHALLIDNEGRIIFHEEDIPMSVKIYGVENLNKILSGPNRFFVSRLSSFHKYTALNAVAEVKSPLLSGKGIEWVVLVSQEADEAFAPLRRLIYQLVIVVSLLLAMIWPISYFLSRIFVKPIQELHLATERISRGDWGYKIDIKTGDEIEELANAFRSMITVVENKQAELLLANKGLEDLSANLEKKIGDRTKDLTRVQEATLNILEDLQETKGKLEASNRELLKLDQLKSDFVSTVSHELRTPLSIIKEGVALVLDRIMGDVSQKQEKVLTTAKDNIDRLARIIDALLDISKIESGKIELKKEMVELTALVRRVASS